MARIIQILQVRRNRIDEAISVWEGISWLFSPLLIKKLSILNKVSSILYLKSLCCICIVPNLFIFIGPFRMLLYSWPFFTCLLYCHLLENIYALFSTIGWFRLLWVYHIYGWKICRHDPVWVNYSWSVSVFVIFTRLLIGYQTWLLINLNKIRDEFIIIHHPKL